MAFMAERMNALGETSKEATRKVISGEKISPWVMPSVAGPKNASESSASLLMTKILFGAPKVANRKMVVKTWRKRKVSQAYRRDFSKLLRSIPASPVRSERKLRSELKSARKTGWFKRSLPKIPSRSDGKMKAQFWRCQILRPTNLLSFRKTSLSSSRSWSKTLKIKSKSITWLTAPCWTRYPKTFKKLS